jgi:hypothetical protein
MTRHTAICVLTAFLVPAGCGSDTPASRSDPTVTLLRRMTDNGPAGREDVRTCLAGLADERCTATDRRDLPLRLAVDRRFVEGHAEPSKRIRDTVACVNSLFRETGIQWSITAVFTWSPDVPGPGQIHTDNGRLMQDLQRQYPDDGRSVVVGWAQLDERSVFRGETSAESEGNWILVGSTPRPENDCLGLANMLGRYLGGTPVPAPGSWVIRRFRARSHIPTDDLQTKVMSMWRFHPQNVEVIRAHGRGRIKPGGMVLSAGCRKRISGIRSCWRHGVQRSDQAIAITTDKCRDGDQRSCTWVGSLYLDGLGSALAPDPAYAAKLFQPACREGVPEACFLLGNQHVAGNGVPRDAKRGAALLLKACRGGVWKACNNLGVLYLEGTGVEKNVETTLAFWELACRQGGPEKCHHAGYLLQEGRGVRRSLPRARRLYRLGCDLGHGASCACLGHMYREGRGVRRDLGRALKLYRRACRSPRHCHSYGVMLISGSGVAVDLPGAVRAFRRACAAGCKDGCASLGTCYLKGTGVEKDPRQAERYYEKACRMGHKAACRAMGQ